MWPWTSRLVASRGLSSVGRALPLQGRCREFESPRLHGSTQVVDVGYAAIDVTPSDGTQAAGARVDALTRETGALGVPACGRDCRPPAATLGRSRRLGAAMKSGVQFVMLPVVVALAAAAGAAVISAAPAHADPGWVTFVFSPSTWNLSQVWGPRDQASAEQAAMSACRNAGASDCQIVASSGDCAAFVKNGDSWNAATGLNAPVAVAAAALGLGIPPGTSKTASECSWDPVQPYSGVTRPYAGP
jgi:hypothetical protein